MGGSPKGDPESRSMSSEGQRQHRDPHQQAMKLTSECPGYPRRKANVRVPCRLQWAGPEDSQHHSQRYATTTVPTPNPTCLAGFSQPCVKASAVSGAARRGTEHSL